MDSLTDLTFQNFRLKYFFNHDSEPKEIQYTEFLNEKTYWYYGLFKDLPFFNGKYLQRL